MKSKLNKIMLATLCLGLAFFLSCSDLPEPEPDKDGATSNSSGTGGNPSSPSTGGNSSSAGGSGTKSSSSGSATSGSGSSAVQKSSSSQVSDCKNFKEGTTIEHYGQEKKQFCDSRDGKRYVYVEIGEQTWMAENLNYKAMDSRCYKDSTAYCDKYGRIYNWVTAMNLPDDCKSKACAPDEQEKHQGVCPEGWHIPNQTEWEELIFSISWEKLDVPKSYKNVAPFLKTTEDWSSYNNGGTKDGNGTDDYGFAVLPSGKGLSDGINKYACFISTSEWTNSSSKTTYYGVNILHDNPDVRTNYSNYYKTGLASVRCVKDQEFICLET